MRRTQGLPTRSSLPAIAGFTLLENLVVIVIVATLAAIAAPGWLGFMSQQRLARANDQVLIVIRKAQAEAKRTGTFREARFNFAVDPPQYAVLPVVTTLAPTLTLTPYSTAQLATMTIPWETLGQGNIGTNTIRLTDNNPNGDSIIFSPKGEVVRRTLAASNPTTLPYIVRVSLYNRPNVRRCIRVETILGATSQGAGTTECP